MTTGLQDQLVALRLVRRHAILAGQSSHDAPVFFSSDNIKLILMIDLRHNYPVLDTQATILHHYMQRTADAVDQPLLALPPWHGASKDCIIAAHWLKATAGQKTLLCSSGNHAVLIIALALKLPGKTVVIEDFTYSAFKMLAAMLGIRLIPCPTDEHGIIPDALAELCRRHTVAALFVQPTIHNPTCLTMPLDRRQQLVEVAGSHDIAIIEDDAYRFLHESPPARFADLAPSHTLHIASLSKAFSPALKVSYLLVAEQFHQCVEEAIRLTSSGTSSVLACLASMMIEDGTIDEVIRLKRWEAGRRQAVMRDVLNGLNWQSHPTSFHVWLRLPQSCSADAVRDVLGKDGVDISSGNEFSAPGVDGNGAIRISLGAESKLERLTAGLSAIRNLVSAPGARAASA